MKLFLSFSAFFFSLSFFSQLPPPVTAHPSISQEKLIDELLLKSNYEEALLNYSKIYFFGKQYKDGKRNYENKEIDAVLKNFDFQGFKKKSIYNSFSFISEMKLKALIEFYSENDGKVDAKNNILLLSASITNNLENQLNVAMEKILKK